ncbi:hypothetical protein [Treponema primitia]|nr:hypothetical protein [Treponema primitia]
MLLSSVQKVGTITPIADSDFLELAHVMGWQCVVKKGVPCSGFPPI